MNSCSGEFMARTKRHTPEERKSWAARWRASGLSGREFARQNGLEAESVYRWGKEFGDGAVKKRTGNQAFTEVRVGDGAATAAAMVEVVLSNGRVLRVPPSIDAGQLRALVEVVESC